MREGDPTDVLDKLLQKITRQFIIDTQRPPDAAAHTVGRALAAACLALRTHVKFNESIEKVLSTVFLQDYLHPSVPHAFFTALLEKKESIQSLGWLGSWVLQIEECTRNNRTSSMQESLFAVVTAYAAYYVRVVGEDTEIMNIFHQLQLPSSRRQLVQQIIQLTVSENLTQFRALLSPLVASCVLKLTTESSERQACVHELLRASWKMLDYDASLALQGVLWISEALNAFLLGAKCYSQLEEQIACVELAKEWLCDLVAVANTALSLSLDEKDRDLAIRWLKSVLTSTLPRLLLQMENYRLEIGPLLEGLRDMLEVVPLSMDPLIALRLSTLVLTIPTQHATKLIGLYSLHKTFSPSSRAIGEAIISIFKLNEASSSQTLDLIKKLEETAIYTSKNDLNRDFHLIDFLGQDGLVDSIIRIDMMQQDLALTPAQQIASIIFGVAVLNHQRYTSEGYAFCKRLLNRYPHLCIELLPIFLDRLNDASINNDSNAFVRELDFLCGELVIDPHCAQQIWDLVGVELMNGHVAIETRISLIRRFPKMCASNKRLYRRIIETISVCFTDESDEIRLAVAATISDLSKEDLIRDVSDVIGWLQAFLEDAASTSHFHALRVHFALMSLHYLVRSDELDFEMVMKVLNKRLCKISDAKAVSSLPLVALEPLCLLLGDGGWQTDSMNEKSTSDIERVSISPLIATSVAVLLEIGNFIVDRLCNVEEPPAQEVLVKTILAVIQSLSNYSFDTLGVESEGILEIVQGMNDPENSHAPSAAAVRYAELRNFVSKCLDANFQSGKNYNLDPSLTSFICKVVRLEEDSLGGSLWQKPGRRIHSIGLMRRISPNLLNDLPSLDTFKDTVNGSTSSTTAIAFMLASDSYSPQIYRDFGDESLESSDPFCIIYAVFGYLQAAARILSNSRNKIGPLVRQIKDWYDIFLSPDATYLSLASISMYISRDDRDPAVVGTGSTYMEEIYDLITTAYAENRFRKDDISKICLGLTAVNSIRVCSFDRVSEIIATLEKSIRSYGGQHSFGAYYAMGMICQALSHFLAETSNEERGKYIKHLAARILGFLVEELLTCFEDGGEVFCDFAACIKEVNCRKETIDLLSQVEESSISVLMTKQVVARYILISCAVAMPGFKYINDQILLGSYYILRAFEWGSGKGIALSSVLNACQSSGLIEKDDFDAIYDDYTMAIKSRLGSLRESAHNVEELEEIMFAVSGSSQKPVSRVVDTLSSWNSALEEYSCTLPIIAMVNSICRMPALGYHFFTEPASPEDDVSANDIKIILDITVHACQSENESHGNMGKLMLGFLCSLRNKIAHPVILESLKFEDGGNSLNDRPKVSKYTGILVDKLPFPCEGTVLFNLFTILFEPLISAPNNSYDVRSWTSFLKPLECLSTPKEFAKCFLEPILSKVNDPESKGIFVSFLVSQISGRRKALFEGRDYMNIALQLCLSSNEDDTRILESEEATIALVEGFKEFAPKLPHFAFRQALSTLWKKCLTDKSRRLELMVAFIESLHSMLKAISLGAQFQSETKMCIMRQILVDIVSIPVRLLHIKERKGTSILEAVVKCLSEMSLSFLEEESFFVFSESGAVEEQSIRICCALGLANTDYFTSSARLSRELFNISSWVANRLNIAGDDAEKSTLRRIVAAFALATTKDSKTSNAEYLASLIEILLMVNAKGSRMGVEWLAVATATWCSFNGSHSDCSLGWFCSDLHLVVSHLDDEALGAYFKLSLSDLSFNLAYFCRRNKSTSIVFNLIYRLYNRWEQNGVDDRILGQLQQVLISCRSTSTNDNGYLLLKSRCMTEKVLDL